MRRLRSLGSSAWIAIVEAAMLLGAARLAIVALPSERLRQLLGQPSIESPTTTLSEDERRRARQVRWAVNGVSARTPWTSNCLPQALAAKFMLRRRQLDSTIYVGAAFTPSKDSLRAHAWLRCGDLNVTGGLDNESEFGAVTSYR